MKFPKPGEISKVDEKLVKFLKPSENLVKFPKPGENLVKFRNLVKTWSLFQIAALQINSCQAVQPFFKWGSQRRIRSFRA